MLRPLPLLVLLAACARTDSSPVEAEDTSATGDDTGPAWYPDEIPTYSASTGVVVTAGGDAIGGLPPGDGGPVLFGIGLDEGTDFTAAIEDLYVGDDESTELGGETHVYRHCTVAGELRLTGDLVCAGNLLVTGRVVVRDETGAGDLEVHVQGTFAIDGVIDLTPDENEAGDEAAGLPGGSFALWTSEPRTVAIPSIVTRGGDANFGEAGGDGGPVDIRASGGGDAVTITLSGALASDPIFPPQRMYARGTAFGPATGCIPACGDEWLDFPTDGFRRGLLTGGGTGGATEDTTSSPAQDASDGGRGGDVSIYVGQPHRLAFDHVDVYTGPGAEEADVLWMWDYGLSLTVFAYTGGLGGNGGWSSSSDGGSGGDGGDGGDLAITGTLDTAVVDTPTDNVAWDGCTSLVEVGSSGQVHTGTRDGDDEAVYRLSAAGGWGGIPGASGAAYPAEDYAAVFGVAGEEGDVLLELVSP